MAEGGSLPPDDTDEDYHTSRRNTSFKKMAVSGMTGGTAHNVFAAGIIHGNVNVGSDEQLKDLEDKTLDDITTWTEGMVRVSAEDSVIEKLQAGQNWITITGNAGEGKTTLGYMVLKKLKEDGHRVYKLDTPEDYIRVVRKNKDSVIMLNDILGAFTFDSSQLSKWQSVIHDVLDHHEKSKHQKKKTRILFINRRNVLEGARGHLGEYSDAIFEDSCVLDLNKTENVDERLEILTYHLTENDIAIPEETKGVVANIRTPHGFPHCCKIFVKLARKEETDIRKFFASPLEYLDRTSEVLYLDQSSKFRYLFKEMIMSNGVLNVTSIEDGQQREDIQTAATELNNFYLKKISRQMQFSHPSIYESVANVICKRDPIFIAQYASLSFIMQKVYIRKKDEDRPDFINVDPDPKIVDILAERFRPKIKVKNFSIFGNSELCGSPEFCQRLVQSSTRKSRFSFKPFGKQAKLYINQTDHKGQTMLHVAEEGRNLTAVRVLLEHGADVDKMCKPFYGAFHTALHNACRGSRVSQYEHVILLIKHGADVTIADSDGRTPLHSLCSTDHPDVSVVELLIKHGADVTIADSDGRTPLHSLYSTDHPDVSVVELLIKHGADVTIADSYGRTPLHSLCSRGLPDVSVVELLIKHGADVNKTGSDGRTPLHLLCSRNLPDVSVVELLIKHGAGVNKTHSDGRTPLHDLCSTNHPDVSLVELLIKHGADVNKTGSDGRTPLDCGMHWCHSDFNVIKLMIKHGADVNITNSFGQTVLHHMCFSDHSDFSIIGPCVIELLIKQGVDVNATDGVGRTPLYCLCYRGHPYVSVIELLIKHGADVNKGAKSGWTPIHRLCYSGHPDVSVIELLIKHGADVNKGDGDGRTALHLLCDRDLSDVRVIELLIKYGADVNKAGSNGWTALHYLCVSYDQDVRTIELLIKHGADVNRADSDGRIALHLLCHWYYPDVSVIELLIKQGAVVNKVDSDGRTALHHLCYWGSTDVSAIELLLTHGVDVDKTDNKGYMALHLLSRKDRPNTSAIELINKHSACVHKEQK